MTCLFYIQGGEGLMEIHRTNHRDGDSSRDGFFGMVSSSDLKKGVGIVTSK